MLVSVTEFDHKFCGSRVRFRHDGLVLKQHHGYGKPHPFVVLVRYLTV